MAVAIGYALGRTRKMKLAIALGGMLAGRRFRTGPGGLLAQGSKLVEASPELSKLTGDVRKHLVEAARTAVMSAATTKIDELGEGLNRRAASLRIPHSRSEEPAEERGEERGTRSDEGRGEERARGGAARARSTAGKATSRASGGRTEQAREQRPRPRHPARAPESSGGGGDG
ncbi:hypothetical protein GCM10011581_25620 [Saccharopolyspora subtropica]|uniref:Uncharacterized protein n=2 Tax=Saccharopolyspora thermophila TaxID=89367 RepID=A0A917JW56_9PSEU|nr:hypothetical protein GCM10011581_25620 [Saccharopolyspora subtropica]